MASANDAETRSVRGGRAPGVPPVRAHADCARPDSDGVAAQRAVQAPHCRDAWVEVRARDKADHTTAVVAFIDDPTLVDSLVPNPDEVDCIFDHPLGAVWTGEPEDEVKSGLATHGGEWWPHGEDYHVGSRTSNEADDSRVRTASARRARTGCT